VTEIASVAEDLDAAVAVDAADEPAPPDPCAPVILDTATFDDSGSTCARYVSLPCGLSPEASTTGGCNLDPLTCNVACETGLLFGCGLIPASCDDGGAAADAAIVIDCVVCPNGIGRRPRGLRALGPTPHAPVLGAYFAYAAHLEAASVTAFRDLRRCLRALGAPRSLRSATERAMADERRHAASTGRLARRFGGRPLRPRVTGGPLPSLAALLADNALEGCVGESYGALVAAWQAMHAKDPEVAEVMATIAREEAMHAVLAWQILRWGAPRVDADTRKALRALVGESLGRLRESVLSARPDPSLVRIAGHPPLDVVRALLSHFDALVAREAFRALGVGPRGGATA
jgi:hypothetical protein